MKKKYKVILTKNAQDDLEHIFYYIAEDNENSAVKFIHELEVKIYTLENFPERYSYIPENQYFNTNYRNLIYKKYRIIYRVNNNEVFILRIIQGAKLLEI